MVANPAPALAHLCRTTAQIKPQHRAEMMTDEVIPSCRPSTVCGRLCRKKRIRKTMETINILFRQQSKAAVDWREECTLTRRFQK